MLKNKRAYIFAVFMVLLFGTGIYILFSTQASAANARNILLFIGDGMGESHRTAARWSKYGVNGELNMDSLPHKGWLQTEPYGGVGVTDSAAAGTALATGAKTYNGYIGVDHTASAVSSILEQAKARGYAVGLVTTTQIGHATPASFASHVTDRNQMTTIVDQMVSLGVDVMLGGGEDDFIPIQETGCFSGKGHRLDSRNLITEALESGYTFVCQPDELTQRLARQSDKVLGLFADDGFLDQQSPSLEEMTEFAVKVLSRNSNGFFLMVEGGQIDWAAHDNAAARVITNTLDFDAAVSVGMSYALGKSNSLLIVTADHETGGLEVGLEDSGLFAQDGPFEMPDGTPFFMNWKSASHTGADVPVTAAGLCAGNLDGVNENTYIHEIMLMALDGECAGQ